MGHEGEPVMLPVTRPDGTSFTVDAADILETYGVGAGFAMETVEYMGVNGIRRGTVVEYIFNCPMAKSLETIVQGQKSTGGDASEAAVGYFTGMTMMGAKFGESGDLVPSRELILNNEVKKNQKNQVFPIL